MTEERHIDHDINDSYWRNAGKLAFSFDEKANKPLLIATQEASPLVALDALQAQSLLEFLYLHRDALYALNHPYTTQRKAPAYMKDLLED